MRMRWGKCRRIAQSSCQVHLHIEVAGGLEVAFVLVHAADRMRKVDLHKATTRVPDSFCPPGIELNLLRYTHEIVYSFSGCLLP